MSKISDNPTPKKIQETIQGFEALEEVYNLIPGLKTLFPKLEPGFDQAKDLKKKAEVIYVPDRFNEKFSDRGWIAYESMSSKVMSQALEVEKDQGMEAAEQFLAEYYDEGVLDFGIVKFGGHPEFYKRVRLAKLAKADYLAERYHACIPLLLALLDGLVNDVSKHRGLFAEGVELTTWDSISGHESGLAAIAAIMSKGRKKTNEESITIPFRNGILHGRELAFDNRLVAAKCWAALFAVRDWAGTVDNRPAAPKPEPSIRETVEQLIEIRRQKQALEDWKPRSPESFSYLPSTGPASSLPVGTPERAAAELLEHWSRGKFGPMAAVLMDYSKDPLNKRAGDARAIYGKRRPVGYKILRVEDQAAAGSTVEVEVDFQGQDGNQALRSNLRVNLLDSENRPVNRDLGQGEWRVYEAGLSMLEARAALAMAPR